MTVVQGFACVVFFWAWVQQYLTHKIFAQLKVQLKGSQSGDTHGIPFGGWFHYVSCPHYLAEIIMYACFAVILGPTQHKTAIFIFAWVLINQIVAGLMSHKWYLEKYSHAYPKNRKAVIPFIL